MAATIRMCSRLARGIYGISTPVCQEVATQRWRVLSTAAETSSEKKETETAASDSKEEIAQAVAKAEEALKSQIEKLNENVADLQDKYKRSLAETENVRTRMKKQVDDAKLFGIQGFCKDLLEVADILGKATESVPPDQLTGDNPHLKNLYEGLTMTETQLNKVFSRHGLEVINPPEGEKFDPNIHEALFEQPVPGKEPGTVAIVTKTGYSLHNRTIRPALVGVYKAT